MLLTASITQAQTILTRWTFADTTVSYPHPCPGDGSGTISYLGAVNMNTAPVVAGVKWAAGTRTGVKRLGTTNYAHLATDSSAKTGVVFSTSTVGKRGIHVCYFYKLSAAASQTHTIQYTTDGGTTWTPFTFTATNPTISNISSGGNYWIDIPNSVVYDTGAQSKTVFALISYDLSGITGIDNNPNFAFAVTPVFKPGTTSYSSSSGAKVYGSGGTVGFDSVTISYDAVLPLSLKAFNAAVINNTTKLTWNTLNELNVANFEVEKSLNGKTFTALNTVNSQKINAATYTVNDVAPKAITYYRLKITDLDGQITYSNVISVNGKLSGTGINIYPNPAAASITLSYAKVSSNASVSIFSTDGKLLSNIKIMEGSTQTTLEVNELKSGKYILTLTDNDNKQSTVLMKN